MRPPVAPMRAVAVRNLPAGLLYEPTWDGFRALAWVLDDRVLLQIPADAQPQPYFPNPRQSRQAGEKQRSPG
jgi:hypothetical protein